MSALLIEVAACLAFIIIFYQCCVKNARTRDGFDDHNNRSHPMRGDGISTGTINNEDLRRFRERMSERTGESTRPRGGSNSASAIADRKELIEKNLFTRQIKREESVKELAKLLAISRGGEAVDEELGVCHAVDTDDHVVPVESADAPSLVIEKPTSNIKDVQPDVVPASATSDSTMPEPSAPPSTNEEATITVDTIATAISSPPPRRPIDSNQPTITLAPIRNLWSNLTQNNNNNNNNNNDQNCEREMTTNNICTPTSNAISPLHTLHKLECSICLEDYSPNDTIAWAKDGGDAPTLSSLLSNASNNSNENGCDHIFHSACLVAWLQDHDECPLCRRKVVHADAEVRFAGWGEMISNNR